MNKSINVPIEPHLQTITEVYFLRCILEVEYALFTPLAMKPTSESGQQSPTTTMQKSSTYVTGSAKTDHLVPAIEIEIAQ